MGGLTFSNLNFVCKEFHTLQTFEAAEEHVWDGERLTDASVIPVDLFKLQVWIQWAWWDLRSPFLMSSEVVRSRGSIELT